MYIAPILKDALTNINFLERFEQLSNKYSDMDSSLEEHDLKRVQSMIEKYGYICNYNKKYKFFKIYKESDKNASLHLDTKYGKAEFLLNITINGEDDGGPYSFLTSRMGLTERIKNPFFSNYVELDKILKECISIYEDINLELSKVAA